MLDFWVPGRPATKGSVDSRPNGSIRHTQASKDRQADIAKAARREIARVGWVVTDQPVVVSYVAFYPCANYRASDDFAIDVHDGDIDKLLRTGLDALTGVVYFDDRQVVCSRNPQKFYAPSPEYVGEWITVDVIRYDLYVQMRGHALNMAQAAQARSLGFTDARVDIPQGF